MTPSELIYEQCVGELRVLVKLRDDHREQRPDCPKAPGCVGSAAAIVMISGMAEPVYLPRMLMTAIGELSRYQRQLATLQAALDQKAVALAEEQARAAKADAELIEMGARAAKAEARLEHGD